MGLKKWIQRRVCDGLWVVMTHLERDVIEKFADDMTKRAEKVIHKCTCKNGTETEVESTCQDMDHECACMTADKLKKVEKEWIDRGIIR